MSWGLNDIPSQAGKLAVVTGATGGLGLEVASALAAKGADVIVAARDPRKGAKAVERGGARTRFEVLNLADLASVKSFAAEIHQEGRAIDLLINNAGLASPPKRATTLDGFELQFGTNFLGHFALTARLMPAIRRATAPRIVTVSSIMHKYAKIDFEDLMSEQGYSPVKSYSQSKLANLIFAFELQRRANANGWNFVSIAAHPGIARTDLTKARPGQPVLPINRVMDLIAPLFTGTSASGALPTLYAATAIQAIPGGYYGPTGIQEIRGPVGAAKSSAASHDPLTGSRLWEIAERLTDMPF